MSIKKYISKKIQHNGFKGEYLDSEFDADFIRQEIEQKHKDYRVKTGSPILSFTEKYIIVSFEVQQNLPDADILLNIEKFEL